jgi:hypothetical protein
MPSFNTDANDVSRRTRDTQKVRVPKNVSSKQLKYTESALWKRRKGKVIQKSRDAKYSEDTEIRGEEEPVCFYFEERNNQLTQRIAVPFTIYKKNVYGNSVVLRGTSYESAEKYKYIIVVVHERMIHGKLKNCTGSFFSSFCGPICMVEDTLFNMIDVGGHYTLKVHGIHKSICPQISLL